MKRADALKQAVEPQEDKSENPAEVGGDLLRA